MVTYKGVIISTIDSELYNYRLNKYSSCNICMASISPNIESDKLLKIEYFLTVCIYKCDVFMPAIGQFY